MGASNPLAFYPTYVMHVRFIKSGRPSNDDEARAFGGRIKVAYDYKPWQKP